VVSSDDETTASIFDFTVSSLFINAWTVVPEPIPMIVHSQYNLKQLPQLYFFFGPGS